MFSTHFYRKPEQLWKMAPSPNHSVVLAALATDKLITLEDITLRVLYNKDNDTVHNAVSVSNLLKDLINYEMVGEVHGIKIEKFLRNVDF